MVSFPYYISDFVEIQRKSFRNFLEKGIVEEFSKRNPITNIKKNLEFFFYPEYYKLSRPEYNIRKAILKMKSYTSKLSMPIQLTDKKARKIKIKWVFLMNLPLMTKRGHFLLNGNARVIVNQIIRSPGIYFQEKVHEIYRDKWSEKPNESFNRYYADFICLKGTWLRLEIDKEKFFWAQTKKGPKIPLFWFLLAMGINEKTILKSITDSKRLLTNLEKYNVQDILKKKNDKQHLLFKKRKKESLLLKNKNKKKNSNIQTTRLKKKAKVTKRKFTSFFRFFSKEKRSLSKTLGSFFSLEKKERERKNKKIEKREHNKKKTTRIFFIFDKEKKIFRKERKKIWIINSSFFFKEKKHSLWDFYLYKKKREQNLLKKKKTLSSKSNSLKILPVNKLQNSSNLSFLEFFDLKEEKKEKYLNTYEIWQKISSLTRQTNLIQPKFKDFLGIKGNTSSKNLMLKKTIAENGRKWIFNKFFNPRTYDLGTQGRLSINKKLGLFLTTDKTTLTPQDVLFATNSLIKVEKKLKSTDDIDHLKNRRVRTSGELLQIQLGIGLLRLEKSIREKMNKSTNISFEKNIVNTKTLNGAFKEFFGSSQLSQFMDQINPLAEMTHKRRLTSLGPGGVTRDTATLAIRGIHPTHYGRICPIETPEGKNTGLVNSITTYANVNQEGLLLSPFFKVFKGQVQRKAGLFFLSAEQEEKVTVAASDVNVSCLGFLPKSPLPIRIGDEFTKIPRNNVEFLSQSPFQMISIATSLIPFLEHDDANRALMGSNMQRQAVPLIRPQRPIVGTGLEARVVCDSGHVLQAEKSGIIVNVTSEHILLYNIHLNN
uniref:DNA-directed RNA polymerase n=1 Tax=Jenufa perforata TaxID=993091 RepID=A0A0S2LND7_9CHLO|nr:beta subunit of RNA polymerase [Jenufa perforata]ALO62891.1 beta subunit of RNA polymerase [Jenufa perforata]